MKRVCVYVYLDDEKQLKALRIKAAEEGVSVSELGKQAILSLPLFLPDVTNGEVKRLSQKSEVSA